jgi:hypothetical protein
MTAAFTKTAQKRQSPSKLKRSPESGQIEAASPSNDPAILAQAIRWVRAIDELAPALDSFADDDNREVVALMGATSRVLQTLKRSMLDALAVDPDSLREVKKPVLRVAHLSRYGGVK